jgi:uncharacterized protein involved in outer membrane biogenesis
MDTAAPNPLQRRPLWLKILAGLVLLLAALVLLAAFFPWDLLRGPVNRYVSEKTGRHFEITRRLDVKLGRTTRVLADGIEFANPDWAQDRHLVKAQAAEVHVQLLPLLKRRIELPLVRLSKPQLGLQMEADGRRTWALGGDTSDERNVPVIGMLVVDEGSAHFVARHEGADIRTDFAIEGAPQAAPAPGTVGPAMPLRFKAQGTWQKEAFTVEGRTGNVLHLSGPLQQPFPAEVHAAAGQTNLRARGSIASLGTLDGANVNFQLQGPNLAALYKLVGVVLPETPRYAVAGQLSKQGAVWHVRQLSGRLGDSDVAGELAYDRSRQVPQLTGQLQSRSLDFDDLAPLVGMADQPRGRGATQKAAAAQAPAAAGGKKPKDPNRKVLPTAPLDVSRLKAMNADVRFSAARIVDAPNLPLDRVSTHVLLKDGVLLLEPLDMGIAGGRVAGRLRVDANMAPAAVEVKLDARAMELSRLFPGSRINQANVGKIHGEIDLRARGSTTAQMLGSSSGNVAMLMGRGQISNLLLELAGLDGAEIVKFLLGGDTRVQLRCAALAFDVNNGLMTSRAFVLDTSDTVFYGNGSLNLATEGIDLVVRPYPKDASILSLRSPLKVSGTLGAPQGGLDRGALAGRAGLALALGAINPLLALAATIETGPGHDADCGAALREASAPRAANEVARTAPPPAGAKPGPMGHVMGAPRTAAQPGGSQAAPRKPGISDDPARNAEAGGS